MEVPAEPASFIPAEHFTILGPQNPTIDTFEPQKNWGSENDEMSGQDLSNWLYYYC